MRHLLLTCTAALFTLAVVATAGGANQFAAGSAKTETALTIANLGEHASFDVHSVSGPGSCPASGQMVYKADASGFASGGALQFQAKLDQLVIFPPTPTRTTAFAAFQGTITSVTQGPASLVGQFVIASAADSGLPGGTGDQFALNSITPQSVSTCETPGGLHPIDQGNIVIKTTP
jgi:hypothetical protein